MTNASNTRRWAIAVGAAIIVMTLIVVVSFFVADRISGGPAARDASRASARLLQAQQIDAETTACRSAWAGADRVASANLDIRKAQGIDLFLRAVVLGDTDALVAEFDGTERRLNRAIRQRAHVSERQGDLNLLCDPSRPNGPAPAPEIEPLAEP